MAGSLRCKMTGCDLDPCGVCKRCGSQEKAQHKWKQAERERDCFHRELCETCNQEREKPDHDWEMSQGGPQGIRMKCARCGLVI